MEIRLAADTEIFVEQAWNKIGRAKVECIPTGRGWPRGPLSSPVSSPSAGLRLIGSIPAKTSPVQWCDAEQ